MVAVMFRRVLNFLRRISFTPEVGVLSLVGSGIWWLVEWAADKEYGDAAFGQVKTVLGIAVSSDWLQGAFAFGPPLLLGCFGIYLLWRAPRAISPERINAASDLVPTSAAQPGRLKFCFGDDQSLSELIPDPSGFERRVVRVALINSGGTDLDDCRVYLERMAPSPEPPAVPLGRISLNLESFSLRPGGQRLIAVASYHERQPDGAVATGIMLNTPGQFFGKSVPSSASYTLLLRATAVGGIYSEATCRLLVVNGRLALTKL